MVEAPPTLSIHGVHVCKEWLSKEKQTQILDDVRTVVAKAPFFVPITPLGKRKVFERHQLVAWVG